MKTVLSRPGTSGSGSLTYRFSAPFSGAWPSAFPFAQQSVGDKVDTLPVGRKPHYTLHFCGFCGSPRLRDQVEGGDFLFGYFAFRLALRTANARHVQVTCRIFVFGHKLSSRDEEDFRAVFGGPDEVSVGARPGSG